MRFNQRALYAIAAECTGTADREGVLYIKENTGIFRRPNYVQRWFKLKGNILFYLKSAGKTSVPVGAFLLERCRVRMDPANEKSPFAFMLIFESDDTPCSFFCCSHKEREGWVAALKKASYEDLRETLCNLRGQLMDLTGEDPLPDVSFPYCPPMDQAAQNETLQERPVSRSLIEEPLRSPAMELSPVLELSLSCRDLYCPSGIGHLNTFCALSVMTPPQSAWSKHAQTEVVESNFSPQYFTNVTFFSGNVTMMSRIKVSIYYVKEKNIDPVAPILLGNAQFTVSDIVTAKQQTVERMLRLQDCHVSTGSVVIQAWKMVESPEPPRCFTSPPRVHSLHNSHTDGPPVPARTLSMASGSKRHEVAGHNISHRSSIRRQFNNTITRSYRFPTKDGLSFLKVWEIMGEGQYTWTVPIQLLKLFIAEEKERVIELNELTNLCPEWAKSRDQKLQEHMDVITYYSDMVTDLEHHNGNTFKKSVEKTYQGLEFIATNLHIQRMRVMADQRPDKTYIYDFVTIGAPAAHSLKFKQGGLKQLIMSKDVQRHSFISPDTHTTEVRHLMQNIDAVKASIDTAKEALLSSAEQCLVPELEQTMKILKEKVDQLRDQCESGLIASGSQLATTALHKSDDAMTREPGDWVFNGESYVRIPPEWHMECLCQKLEQLCLWLESKVDCLCQLKHGIASSWHDCVSTVVKELTVQVEMVMRHVQTCLNLLLLQEEHQLNSVGLSSPRHRKDVILSQAVSGLVTCFILHLKEHFLQSTFAKQLSQLGFLAGWESLLSTYKNELGMLEDCSAAVDELNKTLTFKLVTSENSEMPVITGTRSSLQVAVPLKPSMFRLLPQELQQGRPIRVHVVLFTQGIDDQQAISDFSGNSGLQNVINIESMSRLETYYEKYRDLLSLTSSRICRDVPDLSNKVEQLRSNIMNSKKSRNVDILMLSDEVCRRMNGGRLISCKSAKDRSSMAVTLEMCTILKKKHNLHPHVFDQALDTIRSQGTRLLNTEKNVGEKRYAFSAFRVKALPKSYRPPEGTYGGLQT